MIFIKGNVPSSKNSKQWTGKVLISSKQTRRYRELSQPYWCKYFMEFRKLITGHPRPLRIGFHFVRKSRHKFDFVNPLQTVQDEMVRHGWLKDDNCDEMLPFPLQIEGQYYSYDKENPGVWITIINK